MGELSIPDSSLAIRSEGELKREASAPGSLPSAMSPNGARRRRRQNQSSQLYASSHSSSTSQPSPNLA